MKQHRTSLSVDYVSTWNLQDALRELFQNAIDHREWSFKLSGDTLRIESHEAHLATKTLLLGSSEKKEGSIGKHGEGYKLAALVLARLGYNMYILTSTEIWRSRLSHSKVYDTQQLVFDVEEGQPKQENVVVVVTGLTQKDTEELCRRNLHVCKVPHLTEHVLDKEHAGDVYVGGLYVCTVDNMQYGYDLDPHQISLDRDRRLVDSWNLQYLTSELWAQSEDADEVLRLVAEKAGDVRHIKYKMSGASATLSDRAVVAFKERHGEDAFPVTDQEGSERAEAAGLTPIIVDENEKTIIECSALWTTPEPPEKPMEIPKDLMADWFDAHGDKMDFDGIIAWEKLMVKAENWEVS